MKSLEPLFERK